MCAWIWALVATVTSKWTLALCLSLFVYSNSYGGVGLCLIFSIYLVHSHSNSPAHIYRCSSQNSILSSISNMTFVQLLDTYITELFRFSKLNVIVMNLLLPKWTHTHMHTRKSFGSDLSMWFIRMKFAQATTTYHRRHRCHRRWWLHCIPNPINMKYLLFVVRAPLARWTSERRIAIEDISLLDLLKRNTGNNVQSKCYINTSHSPLHAGVTHWPKCQAINFIEIIHQKAISSNIRVHLA